MANTRILESLSMLLVFLDSLAQVIVGMGCAVV